MMKKKIISLALLFCLILTFFACGKEDGVPDGMKRASDTKIVDYDLFVPQDWIVDVPSFTASDNEEGQKIASSMAHVSKSDRSNISVAQWNLTSDISTVDKWWENEYKPQIESVLKAQIITEGKETVIDGKSGKQYEFSAETEGSKYKFMITSTTRNGSIYVITYTATEENYDKNLEDVSKILENMRFK